MCLSLSNSMDRSEYAGAKAENGIPTCRHASAINPCSMLFSESTTTGRSADKFLLSSACEIFFTFSNTSAYVTDSQSSLRFVFGDRCAKKILSARTFAQCTRWLVNLWAVGSRGTVDLIRIDPSGRTCFITLVSMVLSSMLTLLLSLLFLQENRSCVLLPLVHSPR